MSKNWQLQRALCALALALPGIAAAAHPEAAGSGAAEAGVSLGQDGFGGPAGYSGTVLSSIIEPAGVAQDHATWQELADAGGLLRMAVPHATASTIDTNPDGSGGAAGQGDDPHSVLSAAPAASAAWQAPDRELPDWRRQPQPAWSDGGDNASIGWLDDDGDGDHHHHHHHHHHHGGCDSDDQSGCAPSMVPEPATATLLLVSLGLSGWAARRKLLGGQG